MCTSWTALKCSGVFNALFARTVLSTMIKTLLLIGAHMLFCTFAALCYSDVHHLY